MRKVHFTRLNSYGCLKYTPKLWNRTASSIYRYQTLNHHQHPPSPNWQVLQWFLTRQHQRTVLAQVCMGRGSISHTHALSLSPYSWFSEVADEQARFYLDWICCHFHRCSCPSICLFRRLNIPLARRCFRPTWSCFFSAQPSPRARAATRIGFHQRQRAAYQRCFFPVPPLPASLRATLPSQPAHENARLGQNRSSQYGLGPYNPMHWRGKGWRGIRHIKNHDKNSLGVLSVRY